MDKLGFNSLTFWISAGKHSRTSQLEKKGRKNISVLVRKCTEYYIVSLRQLHLETWTMLGPWQRLFTDGLLEDHSIW